MLSLSHGATATGPVRRVRMAEDRCVEPGNQPVKGFLAAEHSPRLIVPSQGGEGVLVEIVIHKGFDV